MHEIEVNGLEKYNRFFAFMAALVIAAAVLATIRFIEYWDIIFPISGFALVIIAVCCVFVAGAPLVVRFDEQRLITNQLFIKNEIRMAALTCVRYYVVEEKKNGFVQYYLVMNIEYGVSTLKLKERIYEDNIYYCKKGQAQTELFKLYRFIESLYPERVKGYWQSFGI
jgi:hypothetical protein